MAIGDDAAAAGMLLVDGATTNANTIDTEFNRTRDYIAQGMGATDAATPSKVVKRDAAGRFKAADPSAGADVATKSYADALGTPSNVVSTIVRRNENGHVALATPTAAAHAATKGYVDSVVPATSTTSADADGKVAEYAGGGRLAVATPSSSGQAANKSYVDGAVAGVDLSSKVSKSGDTMTGHLYLPNAVAATSGYVIGYINGDGRVSKGASSERYKDDITPVDPTTLGDIFPQLHEFVMKEDPDRTWRLGYIAEHLHKSEDLRRFVVYQTEPILDEPGSFTGQRRLKLDDNDQPIPDSIDFIALLLAQVAALHNRVIELEERAT